MTTKTLSDFENEIFDIGTHNNVTVDIAATMFLNNVKDAGDPEDQYFYHGADHVDYLALKPQLTALENDKAAFLAKFPGGRRI